MYSLSFAAFTGCSPCPDRFEDLYDARTAAARRIRFLRRRGYDVSRLSRNRAGGATWEVLPADPETQIMISDNEGLLTLAQFWPHTCPECGSGHDTRDDAGACCSLTEWPDEYDTLEEV